MGRHCCASRAQNDLTELWSLCNFVLPSLFNSLGKFQQWFNFDRLAELGACSLCVLVCSVQCECNRSPVFAVGHVTLVRDCAGGREALLEQQRSNQIITKLHTILSPFVLRRVKEEVALVDPRLRLPPKVWHPPSHCLHQVSIGVTLSFSATAR